MVVFNTPPNPPRRRMWQPVVLVGNDILLRNGVVDTTQSEAFIRARVMSAPTQQCSLQDRDGSVFVARVIDVQNTGVYHVEQGGVEYDYAGYELRIIEVGRVSDASLRVFVWTEDAYGAGSVWGE